MKKETIVAKILKQERASGWVVQHGGQWYFSPNKPKPAKKHTCCKCNATTVEAWQFESYVLFPPEKAEALGLLPGECNELTMLMNNDG